MKRKWKSSSLKCVSHAGQMEKQKVQRANTACLSCPYGFMMTLAFLLVYGSNSRTWLIWTPAIVKYRDENSQTFSIQKNCMLNPEWSQTDFISLIKKAKTHKIPIESSQFMILEKISIKQW